MRRRGKKGEEILFIGTYVPEECGIATFTKDLLDAVKQSNGDHRYACIAVDRTGKDYSASEVCGTIKRELLSDYHHCAQSINSNGFSLLNVQHEYGIYGGDHGDYLLTLLENVDIPVVSTLHTLSLSPSVKQKKILQQVCQLSHAVVVMSKTAASILKTVFGIRQDKVHVIHHGVPDISEFHVDPEKTREELGLSGKKVMSTFGLISKGKGIEYVIHALPDILKAHPDAVYLVIGKTHPAVNAVEKETYRETLQRIAEELGVSHAVQFINQYLTLEELIRYLKATDIYITPYLNPDQIVSGTLAYAMGCGKAILSTPYLYAKEMLSHGRGMLVPYKNPEAIAREVNYAFSHPETLREYERHAYTTGKNMIWTKIGRAYHNVYEHVLLRDRWPSPSFNFIQVPPFFYDEHGEKNLPSAH